MEDIEFLQHFGGMNPGERFYKMAPHLKPEEKKVAGYTQILTDDGPKIVPIFECKPDYHKLTEETIEDDDPIITYKIVLKPDVDREAYRKLFPDFTMDQFLDGIAESLQNKKPIRRGIPWKNIFRKR